MKHLMLFLMMLATVAAVAAETDGWRDLSGQTDRSTGFVLADGEFPSGANGWAEHRRQGGPGGPPMPESTAARRSATNAPTRTTIRWSAVRCR